MDKCISKLTVCFEDPFWIGVYKRAWKDEYEVCKITFGAEPKDSEVYDFLLHNWSALTFSPSITSAACAERKINPKRLQRCIRKEMQQGIGTKAQTALSLQYAQRKQERRLQSKERHKQETLQKFTLRQQKRKEKHKGH